MPNKVKQMTIHFTWFHERFRALLADANEETIRIYARTYIMMLLSTQFFCDKNVNRVHLWWLPFVVRLDELDNHGWGSTTLVWLYRSMCRVANRNVTNLARPLHLLQYWIFWQFPMLRLNGFDIFSFPLASRLRDRHPYSTAEVVAVVHPKILAEEHCPSAEYLDWWHWVAHRVLFPDATFDDPRPIEISAEAHR
ncbi:hypothetical protein Ahy_A05g022321 [Arachis hypogaea]|uniref:Aminotransferase-like plant mobile domain-containing protein n=1 Tax=Arachis hypogaea TaxID=3818 RepID=A0A445D0F9_ARAHY|nr:hypothetical protein Ahy_A05g022321 [Arachis hypogaea]